MGFSDILYNINSDLENTQKEIIKNSKYLIDDLKLSKDIHKCFYIYCYLLWNGYYSATKKYKYSDISIPEYIDDFTELNYELHKGYGVCRHNSQLLSKILNKLNYKSEYLSLRLNNHNIKTLTNIKRKIGEHLEHNKMDDGLENHAVVFVRCENSAFILDPTILCELEVLNNANLISYSGNYNYDRKLLEKNNYISTVKNSNITISKKELIELYEQAETIINENKKLLEEFYNENYEKYIKINKLTKSLTI